MLHTARSRFLPYGMSVLAVFLALVLMLMLDPWLSMSQTPFLLFFGAVMASAWYGGFKPGIVATVLATLASRFFFLRPEYSLAIEAAVGVRLGLFAVQGVMFSCLCETLLRAKHRAEVSLQDLQNSEEKLQLALSSASISVFQQDHLLRYEWIQNPKGVESVEAILGKTDYELFPQPEADCLSTLKRRVLKTGTASRSEVCLTVNDRPHYYDLLIQPLQTDAGYVCGVTCAALDVTDRKQIEERLEAATQRTASILESMTDAFFAVDRQWRFTYVNRHFEQVTQYPREQLLGQCIWTIFPDMVGSVFYNDYHRAIDQQVAIDVEALAWNDSKKWLQARAYPSTDGLSVYIQDITARKQAEAEHALLLKREQQARAKAEAMQQQLTFLDTVSTALTASLDYEETLRSVLDLIVLEFADLCCIDLRSSELTAAPMTLVKAIDPAKDDLLRQIIQQCPVNLDNLTHPVANVFNTGSSVFRPELKDFDYTTIAQDANHLQLLRQLNPKSALYIPLSAHDQVFGVLSLMLTQSEWRYEAEDLSLAEELGRRVGLAIENARLHHQLRSAIQSQEEALALLNAWLSSLPIGLAFLSPDLRYIHINETLAAINGLSQSEHLGRRLDEVIPQWVPYLEPIFQDVMQTKQPILNREVSVETSPLAYRHSLVNYYPVCLPDGQVLGIGVSLMDVSQLKQTEQALRDSEAKFRSVVESNMIGIGFWDSNGDITEANDALLNMLGYTQEELLAGEIDWRNRTPSDYRHLDEHALEESREHGYCTPYEKEYIRKDGSRFPTLVGGGFFKADPNRGAFFVLDITQRKRAENEIQTLNRALEERVTELQTLLEVVPVGIAIAKDPQCSVINANPFFQRIFNIAPETNLSVTHSETEQLPIKRLRDGKELLPDELPMQVAAQGIEVRNTELQIIRPDGATFDLLGSAVPLHDAQGTVRGCVAVFMDITERKRTEAALKSSQERLVLAQKIGKIGTCEWNFQTHKLAWTEELESLYGLSPGQFDGNYKTWLKMLHPDDQVKVDQLAMHSLAEQTSFDIEFRVIPPDGVMRWISAKAAISKDGAGMPHRLICVNMDITDHKRILTELENSEEQLRLAVEGADLGMWNYDLTSGQLHWSDRCKAMYGLALNTEVTYETFMNALYPQDREGIDRAMARAIAKREDYSTEYRTLWLNGTVRWIAAIGRAYYDVEGNPTHMAGVLLDITDRKQTEDERDRLLQQEQEARQLAEFNIHRLSQLQVLAASLGQALTITDVTEVLLDRGLAALDAIRGWVVMRTLDGTAVELVDTIGYGDTEVTPYSQTPLTSLVPVTDATRTGEMVIVRSPDEYRQRYPDVADLYVQSGTQALVAIPLMIEERVIGSLGLSFATPRNFSDADCSFMMTLGQQCAQALERARLYEAERVARELAESANRIKDEFLAVLSHELRSPLNPILGWSRLLRTRSFDDSAREDALEIIERNAKLQAQLIEDLLDVSRILRGKLNLEVAPVNLIVPIQGAIDTVRLAADAKSIQIQTHLDPDVGLVAGDVSRLQQIVWNLLSNAIKFTPEGGQVTVRLERAIGNSPSAMDEDAEQLRAAHDPSLIIHHAQIRVSDTGKGIANDFLPYVFEHFRQADSTTTRKFGGLGLGLAIVRHLVELHGGTVHAESQGEGQGATFTVTLPLLTKQLEALDTQNSSHSSFTLYPSFLLRGVRVLAVDDEPDMREYVAFVLRQAEAQVTLASSAEEALAALPHVKPDVLLSDVGMPNVDGYMLIRQVRALPPEQGGRTPAIAITAYAAEYDQQQALAAGFQLHLPKPVEPEQLNRAIANLLNLNHSNPSHS